MSKDKEIQETIRKLRNQRSREWARNNKDKIKEINKRYWLKKAKKFIEEEKNTKGDE